MTKEVVKSDKSFKKLEEDDGVKGLLALLRDMCYGTDKKRYVRWIQQAQLRRAVTMTQQPAVAESTIDGSYFRLLPIEIVS